RNKGDFSYHLDLVPGLPCLAVHNNQKATRIMKKMTNSICATFGYYPKAWDTTTAKFSIRTLDNHEQTVDGIKNHQNVVENWYYPRAQPQQDINGTADPRPYCTRVFSLPKTHILTLHEYHQ